jgi:PIN domain nuclease of toxin-antitoxin system
VLDSSALLAILNGERGVENLPPEADVLNHAFMSTVNLAEVQGKLVSDGIPSDNAWDAIRSVIYEAVSLDEEQAKLAGALLPRTRALGLSLGDRACVTLGLVLKLPVYTADRQWAKLKLGIPIHVIR